MGNKIIDLALEFKKAEDAYEAAKAVLKELDEKWNEAQQRLIDAFVEEGVNNISIEGVGVFSFGKRVFLSVKNEDKPGFFEYLREEGDDGILKLDVNTQTLSSYLNKKKELLQDLYMQAHPDADKVDAEEKTLEYLKEKGVNYFSTPRISIRKK